MNVENLEEKKLIFGGDTFIYWTLSYDDSDYTISAFNMGTLYMYIGRGDDVDSIIFPKLYPEDKEYFKQLFSTCVKLLIKSATSYSGSKTGFTAYFLLQTNSDNSDIIEQYKKKGVHIDYVEKTTVAGMNFEKYSIELKTRELGL